MLLREALRVQRGDVVSFVGAGGKTAALFRLAAELRAESWRVLATTTTRVASYEVAQAPAAVQVTGAVTSGHIRDQLGEHSFVFLYAAGDAENAHKVVGLPPAAIAGLIDSVNSDVLLIEADGARRLPFKVPRAHEPVIPPETTLVVLVAGVDALDQPLDEAHVYNAARLCDRYGFVEGERLIPPWMAVALRDPELGLRGVPDDARVCVLLNKTPGKGYVHRRARRVAQLVLRSARIEAVALGAMQSPGEPVWEVQRRVAAIVLAAGESARMGQPKPLLPWDRGQTVIEVIVARLVALRLAEIVVVTGHRAEDVARAVEYLPVRVVHNPDYRQGEMISSVQAGLRALPQEIAACLMVMGDQPALSACVVDQVLLAYGHGRGEIIAPVYEGRRGHPVLFDSRYWPELLALEAGAPRDVIARYPDRLHLVPVDDDSILRDIDTPEQYRRERRLAGLE
ncbi:MAG: selenium cofactor biosynthesis protein YqeC [Chloroflexota bacterium]